MEINDYIEEDDERIGMESDEWLEVKERSEFISMNEAPQDIIVKFNGKPTLQRSKYGGKKQYWFKVKQGIKSDDRILWSDAIISTASNRLRGQIKKLYEADPNLFSGKRAVGISWTGKGMDRSYTANFIVLPSE